MEFEYKCKYLGEKFGKAKVLQGGWPLYECEAPEDTTPSFAGSASYEDGSAKYFCRLATSDQTECNVYTPSEEFSNVIKFPKNR